MGFFDFFSRKPKPELEDVVAAALIEPPAAVSATPPANLSEWQLQLWQAEHAPGFVWKDDNEKARALARSLLARIAPAFGNGKVVDGEPDIGVSTNSVLMNSFGEGLVSSSARYPELHGVWDGFPMRIPVAMAAKKFWAIEMRCEERGRFFKVIRDPQRIPRSVDASDPWAKTKPSCVFLGKGIFLDDSDPETMQEWMLPAWMTVPTEAQELLVREMDRLGARCFALSNDEQGLFLIGNRTLAELEDPLAYLEGCARLMAAFAKALAASSGVRPNDASAASRVTCKYCASIFILAAGKSTCPNCGAAAS